MFLTVQMRQLIRYLFLLFLRISCYLGYYTPPQYIPSEVDVYEKKHRVRFQDQENEIINDDYYIGEGDGDEEDEEYTKKIEPWNQNIDPVFYDRKELSRGLANNTILEQERVWQARILYESTPRGNIVMFYDVYKDGFSYYSDQSGIPYKVLNAVAMKYVITFRCRDFFMDETISSSPFIQYNKDDEKKEQDKKNETMKQLSSNNQSLPFVKFKNRQITTQPSEMIGTTYAPPQMSQQTNTRDVKEYVINRFIYKGKMHNWSPLQKPPTKKIQPSEVLDYKTYRNSRVVSVPQRGNPSGVPVSESKEPTIDDAPTIDAPTTNKRWWRMDEETAEELHFWRCQSNDLGLFGSM